MKRSASFSGLSLVAAIVESENLLIDVPLKVVRLDRNVGAAQGALQ